MVILQCVCGVPVHCVHLMCNDRLYLTYSFPFSGLSFHHFVFVSDFFLKNVFQSC